MLPLTIFTPAYNRAHTLPRLYDSLCRQSRLDFLWLVVDDGSTDGTEALVKGWAACEKRFPIVYCYKENGGLHTAYNEAIAHLTTPLAVCIDSDDYLPDSMVERVLDLWEREGSEEVAGIVGLDFYTDGRCIGDRLPDRRTINLIDLLIGRYPIRHGDRTNVVRSELYRAVAPMKVFPGEKNFNPHYMHLQISRDYDFLVLNENLRFVEYQADGMSNSMLRQYKSSPRSFAETRKLYLSFPKAPLAFRLRHSVHLTSSLTLLGRPFGALAESPRPFLAFLTLPLGWALALYVKKKG